MIEDKLKNIPQNPGCYLFKNGKDQIIYVGMSKFLPKRVSSYFQKNHTDQKTKTLVENIRDVEFVITSSEQEAIITEEELIKLYKPKFNIKGKDDKTRKWSLCFTEEQFPKLEIVREKTDDRVSLDFTSGMLCREVYNLIHDVFELRSCSYDLSDENIQKGKFKPCLEYHLGRCQAPCIGLQSKILFTKTIKNVKSILQLDLKPPISDLKKEMKYYSSNLEFEKAQNILSKLATLEILDKKLNPVKIQKYNKKAFEIKNVLGLKNMPVSIEAFDNSHNQGDCNVAASVRFMNENRIKSDYRKYIIRSFNGINDYASFDEVLNRRFKRLIDEKQQLPNLVIIDGGKGQLNVARKVFESLNLIGVVDLISISKDSNHKSSTIHLLDGSEVSILGNKNFSLLAKIQDEVHRFAIKFHREKRSKKLFSL
jgi:excinuclease ABC subunit C